ncbi:hypothetical protein EWB00_000469 [Schistosoma japonicum]|uniref:Uncharacterized protein n=1 Tax=Schistosoma japonicum TaxID=6182 RepID=A0A4Z2CKE3_SCHJA|nr:hypothetical protein EWB00_000469 [Schistosoma japonicum]
MDSFIQKQLECGLGQGASCLAYTYIGRHPEQEKMNLDFLKAKVKVILRDTEQGSSKKEEESLVDTSV